jgi:hypothetical protein
MLDAVDRVRRGPLTPDVAAVPPGAMDQEIVLAE